jgi:stage III sporulation protein AE
MKMKILIRTAVFVMMFGWLTAFTGFADQEQPTGDPADSGDLLRDLPWEAEWDGIEAFLQEQYGGASSALSFSEMLQALIHGDLDGIGHWIRSLFQSTLAAEMSRLGRLTGSMMALGILGAVFAGFSSVFPGEQIAPAGIFLTYLLMFSVLAAAFYDSVEMTGEVLSRQTQFMKVLLPSYCLAAAWGGSGASAAAWMEVLLFLMGAIESLYLGFLLPLSKIYVLLILVGNMTKEDMMSKMTELLSLIISWGARSLLGIVIGFQLVQGMVLPVADAVQSSGMQKLLSVIPGIGAGAGAAVKVLLGSGVLIKNSIGAAAVMILVVITLVPALKLALLWLIYRGAAAVLQPVADKRMIAAISNVADGERMLLELSFYGMVVFVLAIALISSTTNAAWMAA